MNARVVVVGAGMGGLAAALRLARHGVPVRVLEARTVAGGLASDLDAGGLRFDGGPYIMLDRPGLEWAFGALGLPLQERVALRRIEEVYEVSAEGSQRLRFHADLGETAAGFDRTWPGSGRRYAEFVSSARRAYEGLRPLLFLSRPGPLDLLRSGAWREMGFVFRSLAAVLRRAGLPGALEDAITVWTHVAGQRVEEAPSFLAFVPALIHSVGAFYPEGGIGAIPRALAGAARAAGVELEFASSVRAIRCAGGKVTGVETHTGAFVQADAIVSNTGLSTYLDLLQPAPRELCERLDSLPLQSPGVCAYLRVRGAPPAPYLRFRVPGRGQACRLFVATGVVDDARPGGAWNARLLSPMDHARAEHEGPAGQRQFLDGLLAEDWWRAAAPAFDVVARRTPADWGAEFRLHRNAMNPVMTARLMRAGRLAHRSPHVRGLYLAGGATHPGQWVSFCAISGILAADCLLQDLA